MKVRDCQARGLVAAKRKRNGKPPKVRLACPSGRPIQLRYTCPEERREVRVSTGTHDWAEAQRQKRELEAKLLLGISPKRRQATTTGPSMLWDDFREEYRTCQLTTLRARSADSMESRLDIAEAIMQPRRLVDMGDPGTLGRLQAKLLAGVGSRSGHGRSPHTVKSYMRAVLVALNWAYKQGWLDAPPRVQLIKVAKLKAMKGRPISTEEFERMLHEVSGVVGTEAAPSWRYLLRGLWESALRLDELLHVSWDLPDTIRPVWPRKRRPVLEIPAPLQKNDTEEAIPLLPGFAALLQETPEENRTGWAFKPASLQTKHERPVRCVRPGGEWVSRVVARIGKKAGVVVVPGNQAKGRPPAYATAHDLRRSAAQRLVDSEVPPQVVQIVLRHGSFTTTRKYYAPGDVQKAAETLDRLLGTGPSAAGEEGPKALILGTKVGTSGGPERADSPQTLTP